MPSQVSPVTAAEAPVSPSVDNPYIIAEGINIKVDELYKDDFPLTDPALEQILVRSSVWFIVRIWIDFFWVMRIIIDNYIITMAGGFESRTQGSGRLHLGTIRKKSLKELVHWVHNFYRSSEEPKITDHNKVVFLSHLEIALAISEVSKSTKANTSTSASEASPIPLKPEM